MSSNNTLSEYDVLKLTALTRHAAEFPVLGLMFNTLLMLTPSDKEHIVSGFINQVTAGMQYKKAMGTSTSIDFKTAMDLFHGFNGIKSSKNEYFIDLKTHLVLANPWYEPAITLPEEKYRSLLNEQLDHLFRCAVAFWREWKKDNPELYDELKSLVPELDWDFHYTERISPVTGKPLSYNMYFSAKSTYVLSIMVYWDTGKEQFMMNNPFEIPTRQ